jgi:hypothetical protein
VIMTEGPLSSARNADNSMTREMKVVLEKI